jgi:hypothetical protein
MARTKTKMTNGYTRVRTVQGSTVTTHFIPRSPSMTRRERYRQLEHQILRNLNIIQEFNLTNYTGPISTSHARAQRQRYDIIRENCEVTSNKINHALHISEDPDSACSSAFHAIFLTLRTMLRNEVTRAEAINLRAVNYWHQHTIPAPPTHPKSAEIDSKSVEQHTYASALQRRIFQHVGMTSESSSDDDTNHDSSPRYSNFQHHPKHRNKWQTSGFDRFTMGGHNN